MNVCENCGEVLDADAASCPKCNTPVKESLDIDSTPRVTTAAGAGHSHAPAPTSPGVPLKEGLTAYRKNVSLGVVYFNDDSRVGVPMQNVQDITRISSIKPDGTTGIAKAIRHGTRENLQVPAAKRIGILVTDGGATDAETPGKSPYEDAVEATTEAVDQNILMAVIAIGLFDHEVLKGFASGPSYVESTGVANIKQALSKMTERTTKSANVSNGIAVSLVIDESGSMFGQEENVRKAVTAVLDILKGL